MTTFSLQSLDPEIHNDIIRQDATRKTLYALSAHLTQVKRVMKEAFPEQRWLYVYYSGTRIYCSIDISSFREVTPVLRELVKHDWHQTEKMEKDDRGFKWTLTKRVREDLKFTFDLHGNAIDATEGEDFAGQCRRVIVGMNTSTVETPIYEVICDGDALEVPDANA